MKTHPFLYCFAFLFLLSCRPTQTLQKEHIVSDAEPEQVTAQTVSRDTIRPHSGTDQLVKADVAYDSIAFQRNLYEKSFTAIRSMLEGRRTASFKDAVFLVENAFANGQLDEQRYNREITELQTLAQLYAKAHAADFDYAFPDRDTILQHAGLFAAMKDTLVFHFDSLLLVHFPMTYNPIDFNGEQDWKSTFVSTLLQTGTGNCQSLAYLYNILAEKSGLESHLALAPNHLYVKRPSRKTGMYNTELTNGTFPVDAWIMTSGYVNLQTIQNGIYMQPLGDQQELALCLLDLAKGYEKTYGIGDGAFMLRCATTALTHFPGCISAKLLKEKVLGKLADQNMAIALEHQQLVAELYNSGYRNMPEEVYLNWLSGKSAANRPPENHQPFGRFESKTDRTRTATLSKGTYDEFFADDTLAAIGRSMIDTRTLAVVGFAEEKPFTIDPETAYRFFAVDPLAAKYPHNSPYAFSENRVIDAIELEGLENIPIHLINQILNNEAAIKKQDASTTTAAALWGMHFLRGFYRTTPQGMVEGLWDYFAMCWDDSKKLAAGEMTIAEWHELYGGMKDAEMLEGTVIALVNAVTTGDPEAIGEMAGIATHAFIMGRMLPGVEVKPTVGRLIIEQGKFSQSELNAANYMLKYAKEVILRKPKGRRAVDGETSDLVADGVNYDVYTPTTNNPNRIIANIAKKKNQAQGIVVDLSETSVTAEQLGNIMDRLKGKGVTTIKDVKVIPKTP